MSTKRPLRKRESAKSLPKRKEKTHASRLDGTIMVPASEYRGSGTPRIRKGCLPPDTYFVLDDGEPIQLTTVSPMQVHVGWSSCGNCHVPFRLCTCGSFTVPRSVEYICDRDRAHVNGEEWTINHPDYKGSIRAKLRERSRSRGLSKSVVSVVGSKSIKTGYDKDRLDKKVASQSKRSLAEFKELADTSKGPRKKRLKEAANGRGNRKLGRSS